MPAPTAGFAGFGARRGALVLTLTPGSGFSVPAMEETNSLHGRAVVITGGGTGIGRATARLFAAAGAEVLVVGRTAERLAETAASHPRIRTCVADVAEPDAPADVVAAALEAFGRIDVLVNNAAVTGPAAIESFVETSEETLDHLVDVNVKAVFRCSQGAARDMIGRGEGGVIVNVASVASYAAQLGAAAYGASKAALLGLTKAAALELAEHRIRVVGVAPGDVPVRPGAEAPDDAQRAHPFARRTPWPRLGTPADVAEAVGFLASPGAEFITGETLVVDGGWLTY